MMGPATIAARADVARYAVNTQGESDTFPRSFVIFGRAATIANPSNAATATTVRFARVIGKYLPAQILFSLFVLGDDVPINAEYPALVPSSSMIAKFATVKELRWGDA